MSTKQIVLMITVGFTGGLAYKWMNSSSARPTPVEMPMPKLKFEPALGESRVPVPTEPAREPAQVQLDASQVESVASVEKLREQALHLPDFARITPSDQEWILTQARNAIRAGVISAAEIPQHLEELTSIRMFTVIDREMPLMAQEDNQGEMPGEGIE